MILDEGFKAGRAASLSRYSDAIDNAGAHYREVFKENSPAVAAVIADLAVACGYFHVLDADASEAELRDLNARRKIFDRIVNLAELNTDRVSAIRAGIARAVSEQEAYNYTSGNIEHPNFGGVLELTRMRLTYEH